MTLNHLHIYPHGELLQLDVVTADSRFGISRFSTLDEAKAAATKYSATLNLVIDPACITEELPTPDTDIVLVTFEATIRGSVVVSNTGRSHRDAVTAHLAQLPAGVVLDGLPVVTDVAPVTAMPRQLVWDVEDLMMLELVPVPEGTDWHEVLADHQSIAFQYYAYANNRGLLPVAFALKNDEWRDVRFTLSSSDGTHSRAMLDAAAVLAGCLMTGSLRESNNNFNRHLQFSIASVSATWQGVEVTISGDGAVSAISDDVAAKLHRTLRGAQTTFAGWHHRRTELPRQ